jgi:hypothetical protein
MIGQLYHCIQVHEPFDEARAFPVPAEAPTATAA